MEGHVERMWWKINKYKVSIGEEERKGKNWNN